MQAPKPFRLLCISSHGDTLNSVRPEAEIFVGLAKAGVSVTVMTEGDSVYAGRMRDAGITLVDFTPRSKISPVAIRFIRRYLREHAIDIVYTFNNMAIANTAFAAIGLPVKVVTYRGQTGNISRWDPAAYLTHLHPRVDYIVCVSRATRDDLRTQVRRPENVVAIYKGHDLSWYQDTPCNLQIFGIPESAFVVVSVANNRPRKGVPTFIRAAGLVPSDIPAWWLLVGSGMDAPEIQKLVESSPARDRIILTGHRRDAPAIVAACQVSVLASLKREGLPKTVIEAMVYGVPPVVSDTGGSAELLVDGESGIVVQPGDAGAIAKAVEDLYRNPARRERMGSAARTRIAEHFNVNQTVAKHHDFFLKILQDRRAS
jgi:glycosyltransferase involved in cell wall biosynthesis